MFPFLNILVYVVYVFGLGTFSKPHVAMPNPETAHQSIWAIEKHQNRLQANHPPIVKIVTPANKSTYAGNTTISYSIHVSDKEDGESDYQEISPNDVFLQVNYLSEAAAAAQLKQSVKKDPPGLVVLQSSNCFNCHAFRAKGIGPSLAEISKRYAFSKPHIDLLAKRVKEGSTGVWGTATMPSHPELTPENVQSVVQWILKNAAQPDLNFYRGLEGSFRLAAPATKQKDVYVLTASYTDHGLPDHPEQRLKGQDAILIQAK